MLVRADARTYHKRMKRLQPIFKNPAFIILSAILIIIIIMSVVSLLLTKGQKLKTASIPKPNLPVTYLQPLRLQYTYSGQLPQLDSKLYVYTSSNSNEFTEERIKSIGANFDFPSVPDIDKGIEISTAIFTKDKEDMLISFPPLSLEYSNYFEMKEAKKLTKPDEYLMQAKKFISDRGITFTNLSLDKGYIQAVTTDRQGITIPVPNLNQATFVSVELNYLLDGKPLIDKQRREAPIKILLYLDGRIRKATIMYPLSNISSIGQTDLTLPSQALDAINNGQGIFSRLNNPHVAYTEIKPGELTNATFNSLDLVYIYDYDTGSIQPFYRFQGYGYTKNGDKIEVGVIITALPQDLYIK